MFTLKFQYNAPRLVTLGTKFYSIEEIDGTPQEVEYQVTKVEWIKNDDMVTICFEATNDNAVVRFHPDDIRENCVKALQRMECEDYYFKVLYFK